MSDDTIGEAIALPPDRFRAIALAPRRLAWIAAIAGATLVPIVLISSLVSDREDRESDVRQTIAGTWGPAQTVWGPTLVMPAPGTPTTYLKVAPRTLAIKATIVPEQRHRGLFAATVYTATIDMSGTFALPEAARTGTGQATPPDASASFLAVALTSLDGVEAADQAIVAGDRSAWQLCSDVLVAETCRGGKILVADADLGKPGSQKAKSGDVPFTATLHLRGTQSVRLALTAKQVAATLAGAWPSPSYVGDSLPAKATADAGAFEARWRHDEIGRPRVSTGVLAFDFAPPATTVGVDLIEATPVYRMILRASKYSLLIVVLAFTTYFLLELLAGIRVTLLQYTLLGASLSLFTLLLLSVSEVVGYPAGYALSALLVVTQASLYTASVSRRLRPAVVFAGTLVGLFGFLYVLLGLESYALVVGTVALFIVLSLVMAVTQSVQPAVAP